MRLSLKLSAKIILYMCSVPEGRAANELPAATTFRLPMGALSPGARVSLAVIGSPASVDALTAWGKSLARWAFCSGVAGASMRA